MLLIDIIRNIFIVYRYLILARIFVSWFRMNPYSPIVQFIFGVTEPVMKPFRRLLPTYSGIDFSPILVLIVIGFVERLIITLLFRMMFG